MKYILWFDQISHKDVALVGGKNASLGNMFNILSSQGITVPNGFALTTEAYWHYLKTNSIEQPLDEVMKTLTDARDIQQLEAVGLKTREIMMSGSLPDDLQAEIITAYNKLSTYYNEKHVDVAVRSSATAEDLPTASFAGQQETILNVQTVEQLVESCRLCYASLYTDRAILYRHEHNFDHFHVALSIGIQKMVRSDIAASGVAFSLDPETGFKDCVTINAAWGLGESVVKGLVEPDEFIIHKPTLEQGFRPIIKKQCGEKHLKIVYADTLTRTEDVTPELRARFTLSDENILDIARQVITIEKLYCQQSGNWTPMDVEWAQDGIDHKIYIVQARPETVHSKAEKNSSITRYILSTNQPITPLVTGLSIGQKIIHGKARIIKSISDMHTIDHGDILVTHITDPDWLPAMQQAAGIITDRGGRTCHAAIVSRELGIPALVGTHNATSQLSDGQQITLDCSQGDHGYVYEGYISYETQNITYTTLPQAPVDIMINLADPEKAFSVSFLPVKGVGLARIEFIINNSIKIHPMSLIHEDKVTDTEERTLIEQITAQYVDKKEFFVTTLARGIGMIAAAMYPRPVLVRFSDFKTNEYRNLIGGKFFEPHEENPMLGLRGAFRYYHDSYKEAFALECQAVKMVRTVFGLTNAHIMVPFVRTAVEAGLVIKELEANGLAKGADGLKCIMMCEIPSNVIAMQSFCEYFDGFSIGSNDLTQLTLGVDRDSELLAQSFNERDPAVLLMIKMAISTAHLNNRTIGICGQAPSDYPEFARFLIEHGIDSISLNSDAVIPFLMHIANTL